MIKSSYNTSNEQQQVTHQHHSTDELAFTLTKKPATFHNIKSQANVGYQTVQIDHQETKNWKLEQYKHSKDLSHASTVDMATVSSTSVDHTTAIANSEFKYGAAVKPSLNRVRTTFTPIGPKTDP